MAKKLKETYKPRIQFTMLDLYDRSVFNKRKKEKQGEGNG